jgi:NADPH:quinone reductase
MSVPTTMRALVLSEIGAPDNLRVTERPVPEPAENEVLIKVELAGLLYSDAEARRGTYYKKTLVPWYPGREAAGTIAKVGPGVSDFKAGQRVAALVTTGQCQAEYVLASSSLAAGPSVRAPAEILPLPDSVSFGQALVYLVNFRLAHLALHSWSKARPGSTVLIHGASGGMGSVLTQLADALGCLVLVTCRSDDEARFCLRNGADHALRLDKGPYPEAVKAIVPGGVDVIFNGVGGPTVNLDPHAIAPFGEIHLYGYVAGKPDLKVFDIEHCVALKTFSADDFFRLESFAGATRAMYAWFQSGRLLDVGRILPLEEAPLAHRLLDEGRVVGKLALRP